MSGNPARPGIIQRVLPWELQTGQLYLKRVSGGALLKIYRQGTGQLLYSTDKAQSADLWGLVREGPVWLDIVAPVDPEQSPGEVVLEVEYRNGSFSCTDRVKVTAVAVDLDTDSNNDGSLDVADQGEDSYEQYPPGRIVCKTMEGDASGLDDIAEIRLRVYPQDIGSGHVTLNASYGAANITVWDDQQKSNEVQLPAFYDLQSETVPSVFYVDGTDLGEVELYLRYSINGLELVRDSIALLIIETISWSPGKETIAYVWSSEPTLGEGDAHVFTDHLAVQGFHQVVWRRDSTGGADTNFGSCTLSNYRNMRNAGAICVVSHGGMGSHYAVYAPWSQAGQQAIQQWVQGEQNMQVEGWYGVCYTAKVSSNWLAANWANSLDDNRAMTFWDICYSASSNSQTGESAVMQSAGGRWRVGYTNTTTETECIGVNDLLLGRMNGSWANGDRRTAGDAYDNGVGYTANVVMSGNPWTTLCPSPMKERAFYPNQLQQSGLYWGCIIFDTYMNDTLPANQALIRLSGSPTFDHRWVGNSCGSFALGFLVNNAYPAATTMRAVAEKCKNSDPNGGRELDGDRIQPNGDDIDWGF